MAEQKTQSSQLPAPEEGEEGNLRWLRSEVKKVSEAIHIAIDSNPRPGIDTKELEELSEELDKIKLRLTPRQGHQLLPESKRDELKTLLRCIQSALKPSPKLASEVPFQKKLLSATTGCNPFKPWAPSQQQSKQEAGGGGGQEPAGEDDGEDGVSTKLLLRLARQVQEPEVFYEWTTSYVDESRIYGWDKEADEVIKALVGDEDGGASFRAAAITGVHGSGKTALAQKAFVHDLAKDHFPLRLWVCVGPPDHDDRFDLLYRMLDNLGLDTNTIEDVVVDNAKVVKDARARVEDKLKNDEAENKALWDEAARAAAAREKDAKNKEAAGVYGEPSQKPEVMDLMVGAAELGQTKPDDAAAAAAAKKQKERIYEELLKAKVEKSPDVEASKIGVLLYILHATLSKTGYLIVFDDIRVFRDDGWYSNLSLPPPPPDEEWRDRLGYGLPKTGKHRGAVLLTCRKEDDAKAMVRTGRVFRPPKLQEKEGWDLFTREYEQAKKQKKQQDNKDGSGGGEWKEEDDPLFKELEEMKKQIVDKCLGLPVAIIEAAKGFALYDLKPLPDPVEKKQAAAEAKHLQEEAKPASEDQVGSSNNKDTLAEEAAA